MDCTHSLSLGIIFRPNPLELVQVMRPQDGPITSQVVEVVHDDSYKQVNDLKHRHGQIIWQPHASPECVCVFLLHVFLMPVCVYVSDASVCVHV